MSGSRRAKPPSTPKKRSGPSVYIFGAGKVGVALADVIRKIGGKVVLRAAREGLPKRPIEAELLVFAVRDRELPTFATRFAEAGLVSRKTACVHVSGAATAESLAPLRAVSAGVAQMHPMISFASLRRWPSLDGGHVHVQGDPKAVSRARSLARALGMTPRTFPDLDTIGYHAAAGLVANGAAALAAIGVHVLATAGVPPEVAPKMLGPLLHSVADNIKALGFPDALTGPVRRGEPQSVARHLELLRARVPDAVPLFIAAGFAQLPLAKALGEAPASSFDAIRSILHDAATPTASSTTLSPGSSLAPTPSNEQMPRE
ncbi:DUF2520 domain-containing protein [Pendulispora albinea]|uniref:DUF2520 domain-containing protein n=1 Tax=Pendulispora albinea TaxID=2741071 RepID=A0ABZ2M4I9_9BACT